MLVPIVCAVVAVVNAFTGSGGGRIFAATSAIVLAALVLNFYWCYRLDVDRLSLRRVRPFWMGTEQMLLEDIKGVFLRPTGLGKASRIQFESPFAEIKLMWRSNWGSAWQLDGLRRVVGKLEELGVFVDPAVHRHLDRTW